MIILVKHCVLFIIFKIVHSPPQSECIICHVAQLNKLPTYMHLYQYILCTSVQATSFSTHILAGINWSTLFITSVSVCIELSTKFERYDYLQNGFKDKCILLMMGREV